jgi:hypothetical protein
MSLNRFLGIVVIASLVLASETTCQAQVLNTKVISYIAPRVGMRLGGGDCAHSVSEALRVAGAEFTAADLGPDAPASGDYVWGTYLKQISYTSRWIDSNPANKLVAGDVIQYHGVTLKTATGTMTASHHTSIVAAVNSAGMPTFVYQQNFNNVRKVTKDAIDLTKMTAGYVRVYRPKARVDRARQFKFSIVNNMTAAKTVAIKMNPGNSNVGSINLAVGNSFGSYLRGAVTASSSTATFQLAIGTSAVGIVNGGGYEVYTAANGQPAIRRLSP